jgi:hypothetical protein
VVFAGLDCSAINFRNFIWHCGSRPTGESLFPAAEKVTKKAGQFDGLAKVGKVKVKTVVFCVGRHKR